MGMGMGMGKGERGAGIFKNGESLERGIFKAGFFCKRFHNRG